MTRSSILFSVLTALMTFGGCSNAPSANSGNGGIINPSPTDPAGSRSTKGTGKSIFRTEGGLKILRLPVDSSGPVSLDPVQGSSQHDSRCVSQIYETLVQYKYLQRPLELEPLLLEKMPDISDDGKTYHFRLKKNVQFHADSCFPDGQGRGMITDDVFYSWKRLADPDISENWQLLDGLIEGLDEFREQFVERRKTDGQARFDYDSEISGLQKINDHEFKIVIKEATPRFRWTLAMFQTSIVPREAIEKYGNSFRAHTVGTGPYMLNEVDWLPNQSMIMNRNPNYRDEVYPAESMPTDKEMGLTTAAGKKLPLVDRIETIFYSQNQSMWLDFRSRKLGFTSVPMAFIDEAFVQKKSLRPGLKNEGITYQSAPLLDFVFYGFNMEDELVGGYSDEKRYLRQALALAIDWDEQNRMFYDESCRQYDGMIPPGLEGHPEGGKAAGAMRGPDLKRAKELLEMAGYPNGKGLPEIEFFAAKEEPGPQMVQLIAQQLARIGVKIRPRLEDFSTVLKLVGQKKASMFWFAWQSDYPDSENNLAMFYGANQTPGSNHFNYQNSEYDRLYEQIRGMQPGAQRTSIYQQMRDMVLADCPFIGSLGRTRRYLINPELKNFKATEDFQNWYKYLDVE